MAPDSIVYGVPTSQKEVGQSHVREGAAAVFAHWEWGAFSLQGAAGFCAMFSHCTGNGSFFFSCGLCWCNLLLLLFVTSFIYFYLLKHNAPCKERAKRRAEAERRIAQEAEEKLRLDADRWAEKRLAGLRVELRNIRMMASNERRLQVEYFFPDTFQFFPHISGIQDFLVIGILIDLVRFMQVLWLSCGSESGYK